MDVEKDRSKCCNEISTHVIHISQYPEHLCTARCPTCGWTNGISDREVMQNLLDRIETLERARDPRRIQ